VGAGVEAVTESRVAVIVPVHPVPGTAEASMVAVPVTGQAATTI